MAGGRGIADPQFWKQPLRYMRWASHERPALFWSVMIGLAGPAAVLVVPSIRERMGYQRRERIPLTYPIPAGPRSIPQGYDD